jgi:hypothetical protein
MKARWYCHLEEKMYFIENIFSTLDNRPHYGSCDWTGMFHTGKFDANNIPIYEYDLLESLENGDIILVDKQVTWDRHFYFGKKVGFREGNELVDLKGVYVDCTDWVSWPEMYRVIGHKFNYEDLV